MRVIEESRKVVSRKMGQLVIMEEVEKGDVAKITLL